MMKYRVTLGSGSCIVFFADKETRVLIGDEEHVIFIKDGCTVANICASNVKAIQFY